MQNGYILLSVPESVLTETVYCTHKNNCLNSRSRNYTLVRTLNIICNFNFQAITFSNLYAPEHLIINVQDAEKWESFIENAGECLADTLSL